MKSEKERVCVWEGVGRRGEVPGKHRVPGKWGEELRDEKGGEMRTERDLWIWAKT